MQSLVSRSVKKMLQGLNLQGPNFQETPERVGRMFEEFRTLPRPKLTTFPLEGPPGLIAIKDHVSWGFCPHHLLPVKYTFKVGYIPHRQVLGLSKLARICDWTLTDLPLQEEIAYRVVKILEEELDPKGSGCILQGEHFCMRIRGVKSENCATISSYLKGMFLGDQSTKMEFLQF